MIRKELLYYRREMYFEQWLQQTSEGAFDRSPEEKMRVKAVVREAYIETEGRFLTKLIPNYDRNGKVF